MLLSDDPTADALRSLAAYELPGNEAKAVTPNSLEQLLHLAETQKVLPQVHAAAEAGLVPSASEEWLTTLRNQAMKAAATTLAAHAATAKVVKQIAAHTSGRIVVLKGCATGHLDYDQPTSRFSSDVDILVPSHDFDAVLEAIPGRSKTVPVSHRWRTEFGQGGTAHSLDQVDIDIHMRLDNGYVGLSIPPQDLFDSAIGLSIAGMELRALSPAHRLLHAALHATKPLGSLNSYRDVVQLTYRNGNSWMDALRLSQAYGVDGFFACGVVTAWTSFDLTRHPLLDWAVRNTGSPRERLALRISTGRPRGSMFAGPLALNYKRWPAYVTPLVFPSRDYVRRRGRTTSVRFRMLLSELWPRPSWDDLGDREVSE